MHDQEMMSVLSRSTSFINFFHMGLRFRFLPSQFLCHPHVPITMDLAFDARIGISNSVLLPIQVAAELFSNHLSHNNPTIQISFKMNHRIFDV